ncbi:hypothetical protein Htur_0602 [Haloterrigena turkmenica DSM 5511]|uniref:Uncharacterized protein n=1 Tax=Haloterrigena turkmenica (strain ATCC 51198 / DSM 5511 / JCM 9101 / NCIMB 13204 / VKM B-1734 / 4k) TaxID=543526 RepID=D2RWB1_HALTV|nr:hypothetical protein [Haloterrigena turkmenica]ADB59500.1 hypothetical protein Htur_0602 [Haloterrigena turkmenica DSM 5511]
MSDSDSSGVLGQRAGVGGPRLWVLLRLNRWLFTAAVLVTVFAILVGASLFGLAPHRVLVEQHNATFWIFSGFIGAIITGTSIVVTINQLVLSQELGAVGDQRERMQEAMDFRHDIEDSLEHEDVSPPEPAAFLYELVDGVEEEANDLERTVSEDHGDEIQEKVADYVDDAVENAQVVKEDLEDAQFGTFDVIWNALNFNYSRKIYDARKLRADHGDDLSEEADDELDEMIQLLKFFGPAREHFKTLYFQWELINLSRALLYVSVPALTAMALLMMYIDGTALLGTFLGIDNLVWLTSAGFVIGIAPFVVFIVYILRIATVAKRTLAMGPFILRESERDEDLG